MKTLIYYFIITFLAAISSLVIIGCDVNSDEDNNFEPIEGNIFLNITEGYEYQNFPEFPKTRLLMKTENMQSNYNLSIDTDYVHVGNNIYLYINGIHIPETVLPAIGPASYVKFLQLNSGNYDIHILYEDIHDLIELEVTDSSFFLKKLNAEIIKLDKPLYWRYPENSFYIKVNGCDSLSWVLNDFVEKMEETIQVEEFEFPENGINPFKNYSYDEYTENLYRYFKYKNNEDFVELEQVLETYVNNFNQYQTDEYQAHFEIMNWKRVYYRYAISFE